MVPYDLKTKLSHTGHMDTEFHIQEYYQLLLYFISILG